jgi:metal-responsive CopG/Arc/MetJ family transcriptional regulator
VCSTLQLHTTVPQPHGKWFKTAVPDSSWDEIREYLSNNDDRAYAPKKRKFTTIASSAHIKRAKRAIHTQGLPKVHQDDEDAQFPPAVPTLPQMRKKYSSLGNR